MAFILVELGASPAFANPGGACAGHLVRTEATALLLDCGFGVAGRLRSHLEPWELAAIVISHLHPDHYMDLIPLRYGLKYHPRPSRAPLPLWLPPGGIERLRDVGQAVDGNPAFFDDEFDLHEYRAGDRLTLGEVELALSRVQHYIPSHAMRLSAQGRLLVYSADVAPCQELVEAARGADLFLCEASLFSPAEDEADPSRRGHLTAAEAGEIARAAGVGRLLLTHCPSDRRQERHQAAAQAFGGAVAFAVEGQQYVI